MDFGLFLLAAAAITSPIAAAACFLKGRPVLGSMGALALPAAVGVFLAGRNALEGSSGELEDLGTALGYGLIMVAVSGGLAIPSLFGAIRLARPSSRWASRFYSQEMMAAAAARFRAT